MYLFGVVKKVLGRALQEPIEDAQHRSALVTFLIRSAVTARPRRGRWRATTFAAVFGGFVICAPAPADNFRAFGPETFRRVQGRPGTEVRTFEVLDPELQYVLRILNGGPRRQFRRASSATVWLNGRLTVGPAAFARARVINRPIRLGSRNTLEVRVDDPRGGITILILGKRETISLEVVSPEQDPRGRSVPLVYNSGWPLTLKINFPSDVNMGIDGFFVGGQEHDRGPFPRRSASKESPSSYQGYERPPGPETGFVVLEDEDGCPSFVQASETTYYQGVPTLDPCDVDLSAPIGEVVTCREQPCSNGVTMPCPDEAAVGTRNVRCPDENVVRFTPGTEGGPWALPNLLLLSNVGSGRWEDEQGRLYWKNLADWNSVGYVLDAAGRTSLTAHMNVEFGKFAPVVEYRESNQEQSYDIDGADAEGKPDCIFDVNNDNPACPEPGTQPLLTPRISNDARCHRECLPTSVIKKFPAPSPRECFPLGDKNPGDRIEPCFDARMACVYIPVFERELTIRAFLVGLSPFDLVAESASSFHGAIHMIENLVDGDNGRQEPGREDLVAANYKVLAEATIRVQQVFGAGCHRDIPFSSTSRPAVETMGLFKFDPSSGYAFCPFFVSSPVKTTRPRR